MSDASIKKANGAARPIKSKRDYTGASTVVEKISNQADRESAAEKRLQSLINEMDKFDSEEDDDPDVSADGSYSGPGRRWSDESSGTD